MKMVNIGYVSLIPQNLEGILEDLIDGEGSGSGGSGGVTFVTLGTYITDADGNKLSYNDIINAGFVVGKLTSGERTNWCPLSETSGYDENIDDTEEYTVSFGDIIYTGLVADGTLEREMA